MDKLTFASLLCSKNTYFQKGCDRLRGDWPRRLSGFGISFLSERGCRSSKSLGRWLGKSCPWASSGGWRQRVSSWDEPSLSSTGPGRAAYLLGRSGCSHRLLGTVWLCKLSKQRRLASVSQASTPWTPSGTH